MISTIRRIGSLSHGTFVLAGLRSALPSVLVLLTFCQTFSLAGPLPFSTTEIHQYLAIARKSINGQVTLTTDNFELGANKAPVPATGNFLSSKIGDPPGTGGPTLLGTVPTGEGERTNDDAQFLQREVLRLASLGSDLTRVLVEAVDDRGLNVGGRLDDLGRVIDNLYRAGGCGGGMVVFD